jgi:hypothetical protein
MEFLGSMILDSEKYLFEKIESGVMTAIDLAKFGSFT